MEAGHADNTLKVLKTSPALRALYKNLQSNTISTEAIAENNSEYLTFNDPVLNLAVKIDETVRQVCADDWRGVEPRERFIKQVLFCILKDVVEVERVFLIIKAHKEY